MKRMAAMILCMVLFAAAIGAVGIAVSVSLEESNGISSGFVRSGTGKTTGTLPSPVTLSGKSGKNTSAGSSQGPWLPDPCNVLGVSGRYVKSQNISGTTVKFYRYEVQTTYEDIREKLATYTWELWEELEYQTYELRTTGDMLYRLGLEKNGAMAELTLIFIDDSSYDKNGQLTMELYLAVPEPMEFQLGRKTPGIINGKNACPSCEGSKICDFCNGSGMVNHGDGYETCNVCDGKRECAICEGEGVCG